MRQVVRQPDKTALVAINGTDSYRQLHRAVEACVRQLAGWGLQRGDHLGVLLPNCREFVVLMLAAARMELVLVPHSMSLGARALSTVFEHTRVRRCVIWHARLPDLESVLGESGLAWFVAGGQRAGYPHLELEGGGETDPTDAPQVSQVVNDIPYILTLTSGSTGEPKPIILSQQTKIARARSAIDAYGLTDQDVIVAATPLYHSLAERLVLLPLMIGATCVLQPHFTAERWLDDVEQYGVTFSIIVSTQVRRILEYCQASDRCFPATLRTLVSSSEQLSVDSKISVLRLFRGQFHECYGASEVATVSDLNANANPEKWASVGLPMPGVNLRIVSSEGNVAPVGESGEIEVRTPLAFSGYYERQEETAAAHHEGYFRTGDLGYLDEDGFLYFLGRKKHTIITGGINVYPRDIEDLVSSDPDVRDCAAFAVPDPVLGEAVAVAVVTDDLDSRLIRRLRLLCARELSDYQQPRRFYRFEVIPRSGLSKVDRRAIEKIAGQMKPVFEV
ncbi:class I adenylate-forming enzyme family protein [Marinobacter koreensis]|nr:class I adenylate-forming enzyme family protein [Marinobacter koreensis]MCK7547016.1 acyl--CoA ligase [Marinobacter koreensis]